MTDIGSKHMYMCVSLKIEKELVLGSTLKALSESYVGMSALLYPGEVLWRVNRARV